VPYCCRRLRFAVLHIAVGLFELGSPNTEIDTCFVGGAQVEEAQKRYMVQYNWHRFSP